jgi:uncharacterized glyoxalase superfamily protein PhnB
MPKNPPDGYQTVTPQTIVSNARSTLDFVQRVFGGEIVELMEDGDRVIHSEVMIGDSKVMIASANEEFSVFPFLVTVYVDDVDAIYAKAIEQGAASLRKPEHQFYGDRTGGVLDDQGNQWWISTHIEDVSAEEMQRRMAAMGS